MKSVTFLWRALLLALLAVPALTFGQTVDILIKGGHVIDPKNKIDAKMDVAIADGKILRVAPSISAGGAKKVIDATGLYVTPGIIDMHVHVFFGTDPELYIANGPTSVQPDAFSFRAGVTTMVDAGSAGWKNFRQFKKQTIDQAQTRVLAFINISSYGMTTRYDEQDIQDMNPKMTALMITKMFPETIVGIKSSHYWGDSGQVDKEV